MFFLNERIRYQCRKPSPHHKDEAGIKSTHAQRFYNTTMRPQKQKLQ